MRRVSIITPCYNGETYIGRTIDSVQAQTFTNWEHVIVDDGSTDGSAAIVETYVATDSRLRLIRQPNGGVSKARNNGFAACSPQSDYRLFLDADDCLEREMLAVMVNHLDAHPQVGLAYCGCVYIDTDDRVTGKKNVVRYVRCGLFGTRKLAADCPETPFESVCVSAGLVPSVAVLRRSVYELTPRWDEMFGQPAEDRDLFMHMALRGTIHYVPREMVRKRQHDSQSTADIMKLRAQDERLNRKWNSMRGLIDDDREKVEQGRRLREGRLPANAYAEWGNDHLHAGNLVKGVKCYLRYVQRLLLIYAPRVQLAASQDRKINSGGSDDG